MGLVWDGIKSPCNLRGVEISYVSLGDRFAAMQFELLRPRVEGEVGFHASLDAPSQFPYYVCPRSVNRTNGLPCESENIIS